jgi:hypothetical protein
MVKMGLVDFIEHTHIMRNYNNDYIRRSRTAGKSKRGNKTLDKNRSNEKLVIMKSPGRFAPDRMKVTLTYNDTIASRTGTSTNAINWGYRSSAFDPDPALLTGSIPGFVELANLYKSYCVHAMELDLEISNQNTESCIMVCWPSRILQNTNSLTADDIQEYGANLRSKSRIIANSSGQNRAMVRTKASGLQLIGERFKTDLDFTASTSANPMETFAINIGIIGPLGNFSFPFVTRSRVYYTVEFFEVRQLES